MKLSSGFPNVVFIGKMFKIVSLKFDIFRVRLPINLAPYYKNSLDQFKTVFYIKLSLKESKKNTQTNLQTSATIGMLC